MDSIIIIIIIALPVPEIIGVLKKFGQSMDTPTLPFSPNFKGLLFGWTLWIYLPNLKFVALPVPEIIGDTPKISAVHGYALTPFSPKFSGAFVRMNPMNIPAKFEVRSFTRSWDNRGYSKNLGSPWIRPHSLFFQIFKGLLFGWTLWIYLPDLKFVALPIPEIIGGTQKTWAVCGYAPAPFSPKFFMGLCSDGFCEYTFQIWSPSFSRSWDNSDCSFGVRLRTLI